MSNVVLSVELKDRGVKVFFQKLKQNLDEVDSKGSKAFDKIEKNARLSGIKIGAVSGIVSTLTSSFLSLTRAAADAFGEIITSSIELQKEMELTKIAVVNIFGGNEAAADAFLAQVKEVSVLLGANRQQLTQLAKGILPDIGSTDTTLEFIKSITILGRDAGQSLTSIRIAAEEALSGNLRSLQRRLNIPQSVLNRIDEYSKNMGQAEAITRALTERVEETGLSAESAAGSLAVLQGQLQSQLQDLQLVFAEPISDELKEQIAAIGQSLSENNPAIEAAASALGDLIALFVDFAGTEIEQFIEGLDFEAVQRFIDALSEATNSAFTLIDALFETESTGEGIDKVTNAIIALDRILLLAAEHADGLKTTLSRLSFVANPGAAIGRFIGAEIVGEDTDTVDAQDNVNEALAQGEEREKQLKEAQEERRQVQAQVVEGTKELGDAIIATDKAERDRIDAVNDAKDAMEKLREAEEKRSDELIELGIRQEQARTEQLLRQSETREKIELQTFQSREDALLKYEQAVRGIEGGGAIAKAQRDANNERAQVDRDLATERIGIERDYQDELRRLQSSFSSTAQESAINVDAISFARAQRQLAIGQQEALLDRDSNLADADANAKAERDAIKAQLEAQVLDIEDANQRKLESIQRSLDDELERIALNHEQANVLQDLQDFQQNERLDRQQAIQTENFNRKEDAKLAKVQEILDAQFLAQSAALEAEFAAFEDVEKRKTEVAKREAAERRRVAFINAQIRSGLPQVDTSVSAGRGGTPAFAGGGQFRVGGTGGTDSQLVQFMASPNETVTITNPARGQRAPVAGLDRLLAATPQPLPVAAMGGGSSVDNSVNLNLGQMIGGSTLQNEIDTRIEQNQMLRQLRKLLGGVA